MLTGSVLATELTFEGFYVKGKGQESAQVLFEDHAGFIWIGRSYGLFKYDGYTLTQYQHQPEDSTSLSNSEITAINEDSNGMLWVGTANGLNQCNPANGKCRRFYHDPNNPQSLSHNSITAIYFDQTGLMWVGTDGGGLNLGDFANANKTSQIRFAFKHYRHDPDDPNSLSADEIRCLAETNSSDDNLIWIGTANGLNAFNPKTHQFTRFFHDPNDTTSISHNQIWSMITDRDGELWIGSGGGGLMKLCRGDQEQIVFTRLKNGQDLQITTLAEDERDNLWIGTLSNCLFTFNKKKHHFAHFPSEPNSVNSFSHPSIFAILVDQAGCAWISCQSGIYRYDPQKEKIRQFAAGSLIPYTSGYRVITAICEDRNGNLWLGTWNNGLIKFNLYTEQFKEYISDPDHENRLCCPWITTLHEDRNGYLWIGTPYGLDCFDRKTEFFRHYMANAVNPDDPHKPSSDYINSLYEDPEGIIWIGTARGLDRFNPVTKNFTHFLTNTNCHISQIGYYIGSMILLPSGNLLLGGKGLFQFNPISGELKPYYHHPANSKKWISDMIGSIDRDPTGDLWIATFGNGLFRLTSDQRQVHFTDQNGLPSNFVQGVLVDESGIIWISTFRGLVSLNPATNTIQQQRVAEDWQSNEFRAGVCHRGKSGRFYFSNLRGFVSVSPALMKPNQYTPPVWITSFKIFNQPVLFDRPFSELGEIRLTYQQNMFSFDFTALNYTDSEQNQYAYKMDGFNDEWIPCGIERTALFMNLDPGKYTFRVKGSNNEGVWNEEGTSIRLIITPPWWQTSWAYAMYGLLFCLALIVIWHLQVKQLKIRNELKMKHLESQKLQEIDQLKSRFFTNISHEFRTPLTLILGPLQQMLTKTTNNTQQDELKLMQRNAHRLLRLINQLLDLSKIEAGRMKLRTKEENIVALMNRIVQTFESRAKLKGIELQFNSSQTVINVYIDPEKIENIFYNLLSNALNFTPSGGTVDCRMQLTKCGMNQKSELKITISDTGIGIASDRLEKIFDRFYQVDDSHTREHEGNGIGLALTKELVELHHGRIEVQSELQQGTRFTVFLPLGKAHLKPEEIITDQAVQRIETEITQLDPETISDAEWPKSEIASSRKALPIVIIVEDNRDMRTYMRECLSCDYQLIEAIDGVDGFQKAIDKIPDLIVSDVMMPQIDGYELCRQLKSDERTSHIPVILLTARASTESKIKGLELGADDYLIKPFDTTELRVRVKNLIDSRRKLREKFSQNIFLQPHEIAVTSYDQRFLQRTMQIIEKHLADPEFNVSRLTQQIGMSRMQLHRKLSALTNQSANQFIRSMRLKRAAELLRQHYGNIAEIAYEVGFNNPSWFAECFRKQFGVLPKEYAHQS